MHCSLFQVTFCAKLHFFKRLYKRILHFIERLLCFFDEDEKGFGKCGWSEEKML